MTCACPADYNEGVLTSRTENEVLSLAATLELSENSQQGFGRKNHAQHLGQAVCNSTTALGIERGLLGNRVGSRIQTWNRYAYVGNNPLGDIDPLGLSVLPVNSCGQDPMCWGAYAQSQNSSHASGVNQGPRASWEPWGPLDLLTVFTTTDEGTGHCLSCVDMFLSSSGGNGGYLQNLSSFDFSSCGRPQLRGRIAWRFLWWCNGYELRKSCSTW